MRKWKGTVALSMLVVLLLPCAVFAGQAPGVQDRPFVGDNEDHIKDGVGARVDVRGRVEWFNNLFWYQVYVLVRWMERWSVFV